jgi:sulfate transport system permease protein
LLEATVDLPIAVPTLCSGVTLLTLLGPRQPVGAWLESALGLQILFAAPGLVGALLFVTYPFVVRTVEPSLRALDRDAEDAAATLGAGPLTIFFQVTLPALAPALGAGVLLSFARALGEFGAVVIVAGNIPLKTQTAAVYVLGEIESDNPAGASAMSLLLLVAAALLTWLVDRLERGMTRRGR